MSYYLADANGYIRDFASGGGLDRLTTWAAHQDHVVRAFFDSGQTPLTTQLVRHLELARPNIDEPMTLEMIDALIETAKTATPPLVIADGTGDDDGEEFRAAIGNGNNQYVNKGGSAAAQATDARGAHIVDSSTDLSGTDQRAFLYNPKSKEMVVSRNFSKEELASEATYADDEFNHATAAHDAGLTPRQEDAHSVHGYVKDQNGEHTVHITQYSDPADSVVTSDERHAVLNKLTSHGISKEGKFTDGYYPKPIKDALTSLAAGGIGFAFDRTNPSAVNKVREQAGDLITGVSNTTREQIKELVEQAFLDPEVDVTGLADQITDVIGDADRADTIARTEVMKAANAGQIEAWTQAEDDGLLTGKEQKEWIVTPDDKLCPVCEPMDGVTVDLDEDFDVDGDLIDGPPAHPNCRCTLGLSA